MKESNSNKRAFVEVKGKGWCKKEWTPFARRVWLVRFTLIIFSWLPRALTKL